MRGRRGRRWQNSLEGSAVLCSVTCGIPGPGKLYKQHSTKSETIKAVSFHTQLLHIFWEGVFVGFVFVFSILSCTHNTASLFTEAMQEEVGLIVTELSSEETASVD